MEVGILAPYISLKSLDMPLGWPDLHGRLKIKGKQFQGNCARCKNSLAVIFLQVRAIYRDFYRCS
jgi:hypothetical protein